MNIPLLLETLTIKEKASLLSGLDQWHTKPVKRLGIPSILMTDGPHGIRRQVTENDMIGIHPSAKATCFPPAVNMASTFDPSCVRWLGNLIAKEAKSEGVSIVLGPGTNIKRHPFGGRNFEYFSEDPMLSGIMASAYIQGVQEEGVGTSLKHFALNNQETSRMMHNVICDARAREEIYLKAFKMAVTSAKPWTIMTSYNRVGGIYASEHPDLIRQTLREAWHFDGVTITDWGAMNNRVDALNAGLDLEMPSSNGHTDKQIVKAISHHQVSHEVLDDSVKRMLELIEKATNHLDLDATYDPLAHHAHARRIASDSMVLLKNNGVLPLKATKKKILIIGPFAKKPRYQGSGSSKINPTMVDTLDGILRTEYPMIDLTIIDDFENTLTERGDLIKSLEMMTDDMDHVIVMAGLPDVMESEGFDRTTLGLPEEQNKVIEALVKRLDDVIVVLSNGSPVTMPWIDSVGAVLETYLGGQAQAGATADILFGNVSPSGRLAETFYLDNKDCLADKNFPGDRMQVVYHESLFVGYRQTTTMNTPVLFPFGFGLSYATFEYSGLAVKRTDKEVLVTVSVTNTSAILAKEVIQVYLEPQNPSVTKAKRTLAQFDKVSLAPGETKEVTLKIPMDAFMHFDLNQHQMVTDGGITHIQIAKNAHEILLEAAITVPKDPYPMTPDPFPENLCDLLDQTVYERLLGTQIPTPDPIFPYTVISPLEDLKYRALGRMILRIVDRTLKQRMTSSTDAVDLKMIDETKRSLPLKSLTSFAGIPPHQVKGLIHLLNHRYLKALWTLMTKKG